jgi:uncharacterized protein YggE
MIKNCFWSLLIVAGLGAGTLYAQQTPANPKPTIGVTSTGKTSAKPDVAIVFLSVRSTSPLAADALEQNNKKIQEVKTRLTALGYKDEQVRFTGNRFAPSGAGIFYPGGQRPTGFDVYNNFYVYLDPALLNDIAQFNARVGALLDEASKAGAAPDNTPISNMSMGGSSIVVFALKDPAPYEKQAMLQALEKARSDADEIAAHMKVQITGIESTSTTSTGRSGVMAGMPASPLDDVPYAYFSSSIDEVPVRVNVSVRYTFK